MFVKLVIRHTVLLMYYTSLTLRNNINWHFGFDFPPTLNCFWAGESETNEERVLSIFIITVTILSFYAYYLEVTQNHWLIVN